MNILPIGSLFIGCSDGCASGRRDIFGNYACFFNTPLGTPSITQMGIFAALRPAHDSTIMLSTPMVVRPPISTFAGIFLLLALALFPAPAYSSPPPDLLTNASEVRGLNAAQASNALPVILQGVMLDKASPYGQAVIIADKTASLYLLADNNLFTPFNRGDLLEVRGVTDPGGFAPIVKVSTVNKLGAAELPLPRPVSYHEVLTGSLDAQWIEISGVVRHYLDPADASDEGWRVLMAVDGGVLPIRGNTPRDLSIEEDAEIRVQAICFYQFNQKRQVVTPVLQIPTGLAVEVLKRAPANPFDSPVHLAANLFQFTANEPTGHRIHVRGIVTHAQRGSHVWIRDSSAGLRIQSAQNESLQPGDEIDVLGFPTYGSYPFMLEDATFRKIGSATSPAPLQLTNATNAFDHEDDLVSTDAMLTEVQPIIDGLSFNFDLGGTVFKGILKLPESQRAHSTLKPGSLIRVSGICSVIHDDVRPLMGIWQPQAFQILIRSPADLLVLREAPWWTYEHEIYVLVTVSIVLLIAIGVGILNTRHRLNEQAHRRAMAEAEFAAILTERNRVAREIHDTLAQGLAATSVQLRLAKKHAKGDPESLNQHLDLAQEYARESLAEARNSIWNMRSQVLETGDLADALRGILKQMATDSEIQTAVEVTGRSRRLAPVLENNLLRVGQEAITNSVRHSRAHQITVSLDFGEKQFRLSVRDDGQGFDSEKSPAGGGSFGLVGMRERAAELKGEVAVHSAPDRGTEIILTVPLPGE
jgi:signal transduction histidine kinase